MAHDRIEGEDVAFTHERIALMLGIRRAGVSGALSDLEAKGLIATNRKSIAILDRAGLAASTARPKRLRSVVINVEEAGIP